MAYDLWIFDLDGTLIDSVGDIAAALRRTLGRDFGDRQVAGWVGSGVQELLRRAGVREEGAALDELGRRYREEYARSPVQYTRPYLRVKETLRKLHGDKAVATNKPGKLARAIVEQLGLAHDFALVVGEDDCGRKKPDPLMVDIIRGKLGVEKARTLYVGDSLVDAATAQAAGVDLALVTWGYDDAAKVRAWPAKYHIERFDELLALSSRS